MHLISDLTLILFIEVCENLKIFFFVFSGEGALWAKWALIFIISVVAIVLIMKVRYMRKQHALTRNRERSKLILTDFEVRDDPLT